MRIVTLLSFVLASLLSYAALDVIDADGVTETGGNPSYARMLPRTRPDGILDSSLLPPVADWGSRPIPGVSYVASQASSAGNGSVQYPFKSLRAAIGAGNKTLVVIPGTYSESVALTDGANVSLFGLGALSYVNELRISVSGIAAVSLVGVSAGTVSVSGGSVNLHLTDSTVSRLNLYGEGMNSVVRLHDMGSRVLSTSHACSILYQGRDTIDKAEKLASVDCTLSFSGRRLVTETETVAYLTDVSSATNGLLSSTIADLQAEDLELHGRIDAETEERASSYESLSNNVTASLSAMDARIEEIGDGWNTRLDTLSSNVGNLWIALADFTVKETNDVDKLEKKIANETKKAADDNDALEIKLRGETNAGLLELREAIPGIADTRANVQIESAREGIISEAVRRADTNAYDRIEPVILRIDGLEEDVDDLQAENREQASDIAGLKSDVTSTSRSVSALEKKEASDIRAVTNMIDGVRKEYAAADKSIKTELSGSISSLRADVPGIADTRAEIAISNARSGIVDDAYEKSLEGAADLIKPVSETVSTMGTKVTTLQITVSSLEDTVSDLDSSVGDISDAQGTLNTKVENYNKNTKADIKSLTDWKTEMETWKKAAEDRDRVRRDRINAILAILRSLKGGAAWSTINIPADIGSGE